MVLQSFQNLSEHSPEHETIQFEEHSSIQKKLKIEPNPTQVKYNHTTGRSKTKNLKSGLMVLQSLQNVSEHRLEHETIQFEEHSSIEKILKI